MEKGRIEFVELKDILERDERIGATILLKDFTADLNNLIVKNFLKYSQEKKTSSWSKLEFEKKVLLEDKVDLLEEKIDDLEMNIAVLEKKFGGFSKYLEYIKQNNLIESGNVIEIEEMTKEEAKERIEKYLEKNENVGTGELMINLGIDLEVLIEALDELEKEEKIEARE